MQNHISMTSVKKLNHNPNQSAVSWVIGEIMRHQMTMYGTSSMPLYIMEKGLEMEQTQHLETWVHGISENEPIVFEQFWEKKFL